MIEKNWDDGVIYNIGFMARIHLKNGEIMQKEIHQTVVLPIALSESEIKSLILRKFDHSIDVTYVDELYSALILKK
ncbi:hypothetical protein CKN86_05170 [Carnobacterium divergens]|uniref:hypothetical protein n=1 Tax=Carnobacterium divergens TaxID=2748 RepID=UPI000D4E1BB8|nr:hypothetical protein [Carnobacterium divergens]MCO6019173.1 hypothetical protein [Carnobacterium divergens]TFI63541.1 hypothetical protein CKN62_05205 [Carnobacterium divergens]TFI90501.1 hypothetical protein CKN84_05205 [Carnobacterium divergens]TFJ05222.1 hypothetical protein CKN86_05170 [Carnobacterium divergens]TFJ06844.1 hypothetical protein CKN65_05210 [Carnobacterium divergens]